MVDGLSEQAGQMSLESRLEALEARMEALEAQGHWPRYIPAKVQIEPHNPRIYRGAESGVPEEMQGYNDWNLASKSGKASR